MGLKKKKFVNHKYFNKLIKIFFISPNNKKNPFQIVIQLKNISVPKLNGVKLIGVYNENSY